MKRWLRWGCLTVIVLVGIVLVWSAFLFGTALVKSRGEELVTTSLRPDLPLSAEAARGNLEPRGPLDPASPTSEDRPAVGRVLLDFSVGEFRVECGEPGEGIRVEADYDRNSYELVESFEPSADGPWVYRVEFRETGLIKDGGLRALFGAAYPDVVVTLPPDLPLALEGKFEKGGTMIDAGGLWLTELDITAEKGGFMLTFDEPTVEPVRRMAVRARQGGAVIASVGNASPRQLEIGHSMGGLVVHLGGDWQQDADVSIRSSMNSTTIQMPDNARAEWVAGSRHISVRGLEQPETPAPTLRMSVRKWIGPMRIQPD